MNNFAVTNIIIADDHPIFRRGLKEVIEPQNGFRILAEANDGDEAIAAIELHRPQIATRFQDAEKKRTRSNAFHHRTEFECIRYHSHDV